jgi:hypothetical protein
MLVAVPPEEIDAETHPSLASFVLPIPDKYGPPNIGIPSSACFYSSHIFFSGKLFVTCEIVDIVFTVR